MKKSAVSKNSISLFFVLISLICFVYIFYSIIERSHLQLKLIKAAASRISPFQLSAFQIWNDPFEPTKPDCFGTRDCIPGKNLVNCSTAPNAPTANDGDYHAWAFTSLNQRIWDLTRVKKWIDKAVSYNVFNAFNLGDDNLFARSSETIFELGTREYSSGAPCFGNQCYDEFGAHCKVIPSITININSSGPTDLKQIPYSFGCGRTYTLRFNVSPSLAGTGVLELGWYTGPIPDEAKITLDENPASVFSFRTSVNSAKIERWSISLAPGVHTLKFETPVGDGYALDFIALRKSIRLFTNDGLRSDLDQQVVRPAFRYAHENNLYTMIEPGAFPFPTTSQNAKIWLDSVLNKNPMERADYIVFSIDRFLEYVPGNACTQSVRDNQLLSSLKIFLETLRRNYPQTKVIIDLTTPAKCFPKKDFAPFISSLKEINPFLIFSTYGFDIRGLELDSFLLSAVGNEFYMAQLNPTDNAYGLEGKTPVCEQEKDDHICTNKCRTEETLRQKIFNSNYSNIQISGLNWGYEEEIDETMRLMMPYMKQLPRYFSEEMGPTAAVNKNIFQIGKNEQDLVCSSKKSYCNDELGYHCSYYFGDLTMDLTGSQIFSKSLNTPSSIGCGKKFSIIFNLPVSGNFQLQTGWYTSITSITSILIDGNSVQTLSTSPGQKVNVLNFAANAGHHTITYEVKEGNGFGLDFISLNSL